MKVFIKAVNGTRSGFFNIEDGYFSLDNNDPNILGDIDDYIKETKMRLGSNGYPISVVEKIVALGLKQNFYIQLDENDLEKYEEDREFFSLKLKKLMKPVAYAIAEDLDVDPVILVDNLGNISPISETYVEIRKGIVTDTNYAELINLLEDDAVKDVIIKLIVKLSILRFYKK